ncbi:MAG: hypothetical protein AAF617_02845, partial [Bacteroidota bacterium]
MKTQKYVLFDAANTLIHKPTLWIKYIDVLHEHGIKVSLETLKKNHKLLSEVIKFPDVTSREFYHQFNAEIIYSLGAIPTKTVLESIFESCKYLPWETFPDTQYLEQLKCPIGVASNFNTSLRDLLAKLFPNLTFNHIFISEEER